MHMPTEIAAGLAAWLLAVAVHAQDVTLLSRDGSIEIAGTLQGFDGEFYRIDTTYGRLTVDAEGVICDGPACPTLMAPKAVVRILGAPEPGQTLIPALLAGFAHERGLQLQRMAGRTDLIDPLSGRVLAEFSFAVAPRSGATVAMLAGEADLVLASRAEKPFGTRAVALDALVPLVATDNPIPSISTGDLFRALTGKAQNWAEIGGPDMPIVLHGLAPGSDLQVALAERLGTPSTPAVIHPDAGTLAAAVARDPYALALAGQSRAAPARVLPLTDSCGFPLNPTALAVKAEDYPLTLPVLMLTPPRRLPLMAREFLDFVASPAARTLIAAEGLVDRGMIERPLAADGPRLLAAIRMVTEDVNLADLKQLAARMERANRLSLTFRFDEGGGMEPSSRQNLNDLAEAIEAGLFSGRRLVLAGFSDGDGPAAANFAPSRRRAGEVRDALQIAAPDASPAALPELEGFGELLPIACDATAAGRRLNRRVEVWMLPTPF